jgi:hypothetical protein
MKPYAVLLIGCTFLTTQLLAQITNGGFEDWTDDLPDGWITNNSDPQGLYPITQSTGSQAGAFAIRGEVVLSDGSGQPYPPVLQRFEEPVSGTPGDLTGWYRFNPVAAGDQFTVSVTLLDGDNGLVALGVRSFSAAQAAYAQFFVPLDYSIGNGNAAAKANFAFGLAPATNTAGSWFLLDDLSFQGTASVHEAERFTATVGRPYPQPVNEAMNLDIDLPTAGRVRVELLDALGRMVAVPLDEVLTAGNTRLTWPLTSVLANGRYVLRVMATDRTFVRQFTVQR